MSEQGSAEKARAMDAPAQDEEGSLDKRIDEAVREKRQQDAANLQEIIQAQVTLAVEAERRRHDAELEEAVKARLAEAGSGEGGAVSDDELEAIVQARVDEAIEAHEQMIVEAIDEVVEERVEEELTRRFNELDSMPATGETPVVIDQPIVQVRARHPVVTLLLTFLLLVVGAAVGIFVFMRTMPLAFYMPDDLGAVSDPHSEAIAAAKAQYADAKADARMALILAELDHRGELVAAERTRMQVAQDAHADLLSKNKLVPLMPWQLPGAVAPVAPGGTAPATRSGPSTKGKLRINADIF